MTSHLLAGFKTTYMLNPFMTVHCLLCVLDKSYNELASIQLEFK